MMRGVATFRIKNAGRGGDSRESIKNCGELLEIEVKFQRPSDTELGKWEEPIPKKSQAKNLTGLFLTDP
jgi:hypothetical protein